MEVNMQIFVRSQQTHVIDVTGDETIADIKAMVALKESMPVEGLALYSEGRPLADSESLSVYANMASLDVEMRLLGGKVHGSLARAGKVKGQTPKVEADEEKRKKKTGRAKRRLQYKRRFVNVVASFGRKRGPNSNSS